MSSTTPRTHVEHPGNSAPRVVVVRCSAERAAEQCRSTFTARMNSTETEAAACRRVLAAALAGSWARRRNMVWCPSCARRLLVTTT